MQRGMALVLCTFLAASLATAGELEGVTMPDTVTVDGQTLVLNGMGLREKLWINVYVAGLYLTAKSSDAQQILASDGPKQLRMHFVYKKVATKKLTDAWTEGLEANAGDKMNALKAGLDQLNGWMVDMLRGDEMVFTELPGKGLRVEIKGQEKGVIEDQAFSRAFWSIFIGSEPPTQKLKKGLLGQS